MNKKNLYLAVSVISCLVFIGYMTEPGPYKMLGFSVSIWLIRFAWLCLTMVYFANYLRLKKLEQKVD